MTVKDLSEFLGKSEATIRRACKELHVESENGKTKTFSKEEVEIIANRLFKKVPLSVKESIKITFAKDKGQALSNEKVSFNDVMQSIKALADTVNFSLQSTDMRLKNLETRFEERKALLPAPQKTDRDNLNQIIRNYSVKNDLSYSVVWSKLYNEAYYRLGLNLKISAKNRNMSIIDYAESEGLLSDLLSMAMELFN